MLFIRKSTCANCFPLPANFAILLHFLRWSGSQDGKNRPIPNKITGVEKILFATKQAITSCQNVYQIFSVGCPSSNIGQTDNTYILLLFIH